MLAVQTRGLVDLLQGRTRYIRVSDLLDYMVPATTPAATNPATPETAVFILAGLVGVAALYFGYLTYVRGGRDADTDLWLYGLLAVVALGGFSTYLTLSRINFLPEVSGAEAVGVLVVSVFLMLMFKEGAEFFEG